MLQLLDQSTGTAVLEYRKRNWFCCMNNNSWKIMKIMHKLVPSKSNSRFRTYSIVVIYHNLRLAFFFFLKTTIFLLAYENVGNVKNKRSLTYAFIMTWRFYYGRNSSTINAPKKGSTLFKIANGVIIGHNKWVINYDS